jgi:hypothetical protein
LTGLRRYTSRNIECILEDGDSPTLEAARNFTLVQGILLHSLSVNDPSRLYSIGEERLLLPRSQSDHQALQCIRCRDSTELQPRSAAPSVPGAAVPGSKSHCIIPFSTLSPGLWMLHVAPGSLLQRMPLVPEPRLRSPSH